MSAWAQLEAHTAELNAAIETLARHCRNIEADDARNAPQSLIPPEAPAEVHRARRPILANIAKLQTLLAEPEDFLQELARQVGASPPCPTTLVDIPTPELTMGNRLRRTNFSPA